MPPPKFSYSLSFPLRQKFGHQVNIIPIANVYRLGARLDVPSVGFRGVQAPRDSQSSHVPCCSHLALYPESLLRDRLFMDDPSRDVCHLWLVDFLGFDTSWGPRHIPLLCGLRVPLGIRHGTGVLLCGTRTFRHVHTVGGNIYRLKDDTGHLAVEHACRRGCAAHDHGSSAFAAVKCETI